MFKKKPEGYRELLVYQKAEQRQRMTEELILHFSKTKTSIALADQMSRSDRSTSKNITEGWKRNTTKEYLQFLGFAIASNAELMEDCADIATGVYNELKGVKGIMGARGVMGRGELDKLKFFPLDQNLSPIVKLFLLTKEIGFLIYRLQQSLDVKMEEEGTRPIQDKTSERLSRDKLAKKNFEELLKKYGSKK